MNTIIDYFIKIFILILLIIILLFTRNIKNNEKRLSIESDIALGRCIKLEKVFLTELKINNVDFLIENYKINYYNDKNIYNDLFGKNKEKILLFLKNSTSITKIFSNLSNPVISDLYSFNKYIKLYDFDCIYKIEYNDKDYYLDIVYYLNYYSYDENTKPEIRLEFIKYNGDLQ